MTGHEEASALLRLCTVVPLLSGYLGELVLLRLYTAVPLLYGCLGQENFC